MKKTAKRCLTIALLTGASYGATTPALAATVSASSCAQSNVASAITSAAAGDTVLVPAGSCTWAGLSISKAIHLKGAGVGSTNITLGTGNSITKQSAGSVRVSGFSFNKSGGGNTSNGFVISGAWRGTEPVIIEGNSFTNNGSGMFRINVAGGVIIAKNTFSGQWDDYFTQLKDDTDKDGSWTTADTFGAKDSTGKLNIYVEENIFNGGIGTDCDDAARLVWRYNKQTYTPITSHGKETSAHGCRHFEFYGNEFNYPSSCPDQICNINRHIWLRGATGVIFNNYFQDINGMSWGNKPELVVSIRGAEDARPQGACSSVSYPVPHQVGTNFNGSAVVAEPIRVWGNTGTLNISGGWAWGNPCGFNWDQFFQNGRDVVVGTPKSGYAAYTYPHPLRQGGTSGSAVVLPAPSGLIVQ